MTEKETARTVIGIIGNVISFFLFLSPVPTMIKIIKQKAVEEFKPDPYIATVLNCAMWTLYGLPFVKPHSILVTTINAVGLVIELIYCVIFFIYSPWKRRRRIVLFLDVEAVIMAGVVLITMLVFHTTRKRSLFVGILAIILNVIMYTSPLTVMKLVIKTKSVKYMPFYLSLANFCNGLIWLVYALLKIDINVAVPNGLGALSGLVQLILYAVYYRTTQWDDDQRRDTDHNRSDQREVELAARP